MNKETKIETINGVDMVRIFSQKRKGKPCPTYSFLVPFSKYKPN